MKIPNSLTIVFCINKWKYYGKARITENKKKIYLEISDYMLEIEMLQNNIMFIQEHMGGDE